MARPGLRNHPKFKRLLALLRIPEAHIYGHLQMLWDAAYEFGEDIGDSMDVEINAGWAGDSGVLCAALASCAGSDRPGFIESNPDKPGHWRVHDLYDHAPQYVQRRMEREAQRMQKGQTISDLRRSAAKEMHLRKKSANENHLQSVAHENMQMAANDSTPSPSPSPSPITTTTVQQAEPKQRKRRTRDEIMSCYPDTVRQVVNAVLPVWPGEDPDGRPINPDRELLCVNVDMIFKDHPEAKPELLIEAAKAYLSKPKMRFCAPQYFFGRGKPGGDPPHWVAEYRMAQHQAQRKREDPPELAAAS